MDQVDNLPPGPSWWETTWEPLLSSQEKKSLGNTNEDVDLSPVPAGEFWELEHVSAENLTSDFTVLRLGVARGVGFVPLEEDVSVAANELVWNDHPIYLRELETLRVRFTGTTSGDRLQVNINGLRHKGRATHG